MPELPEVETVRQTLRALVLNRKIENIDVYWDKIIDGDTQDFINKMRHQEIVEVDRKGKYLVFVLNNGAFLSHLRMEGKYLYEDASTPLEKHSHVVFHLDNGMDLRYHDTRKFGRIQIVSLENYRNEDPLNKLGKEPFELSGKDFHELIATTSLPIKTVLLDQTKIAGLGNIYANEVLFRCAIHPLTKANHLSLNKCQLIVDKSIEVLNEAIEQGGTTIRSFSSNGIHGLFTQKLMVHGKVNEECPRCGYHIIRKKINQRSAYYCPKCQKIIRKK